MRPGRGGGVLELQLARWGLAQLMPTSTVLKYFSFFVVHVKKLLKIWTLLQRPSVKKRKKKYLNCMGIGGGGGVG